MIGRAAERQRRVGLDVETPAENVDARAMEALYDLAPGEAAVAALLAEGLPLPEIAARLGMTRETVRTYLKRAYVKTGTASQAELATLVLRSFR